jgi:hypothetical protein
MAPNNDKSRNNFLNLNCDYFLYLLTIALGFSTDLEHVELRKVISAPDYNRISMRSAFLINM